MYSLQNGQKLIANPFNNHFADLGRALRADRRICNRNFNSYLNPNTYANITWNNTTVEEIKNVILHAKNTNPGPDLIPIHIFKNNIDIFAPVITHLCNLSLSTGIFPNVHKKGNIIPLCKGNTMGTDDFYEAQSRLDGAFCQITEDQKFEFLKVLNKANT